jgi:hypothetical protein
VTAQWPHSPLREGSGTEARAFVPPARSTLEAASFDIACRIFLARIAPADTVWKDVAENDFCAFSRALVAFQEYVTSRDRALNDTDKKAARDGPLALAQGEIDRLLAAGTALVYVYKLGGYIDIERFGSVPPNDAAQVKTVLDQAESRFKEYLTRLSALKSGATDVDAQERLAYLAARQGRTISSDNIAATRKNAKDFLVALNQVAPRIESVTAFPGPGASIGSVTIGNAGTLCCFVKDNAGKRYLVTARHIAGEVGTKMVSPALLEKANSEEIGTVAKIVGSIALVEITSDKATNGTIAGLAEDVQVGAVVTMAGRTTKSATGKVTDKNATINIYDELEPLKDLIVTEGISAPGDSGAPVLDESKKLVGLLIARSDTHSLVLPLARIFREQSLSLL